MSIILWYDVLPLITFNYVFPTSSTKHNPYMNFSHGHNVQFWLHHSLVMFLNIVSIYSLSHGLHEMQYFWSHRSYLTFKGYNKMYLSLACRHTHTHNIFVLWELHTYFFKFTCMMQLALCSKLNDHYASNVASHPNLHQCNSSILV